MIFVVLGTLAVAIGAFAMLINSGARREGTTVPKPAEASFAASSGKARQARAVSSQVWEERISGAGVEDYDGLMDEVLALPEDGASREAAAALLLRWLNDDQAGLLEYLDARMLESQNGREMWAKLIPAFVEALPGIEDDAASGPELAEIVEWLAENYAEIDPLGALAWVENWVAGPTRETAVVAVVGDLAGVDLDRATRLMTSLQSPGARMSAASQIAERLAGDNAESAFAWAGMLTNDAERTMALQGALGKLAETDPATAANRFHALGGGESLAAVSGKIAGELVRRHPEEGMRWAESLPQGAAREEAIKGGVVGWAGSRPEEAWAYFQSNPTNEPQIVGGLFEAWTAKSPAEAGAEAARIADAGLREEAVRGVVEAWPESVDSLGDWIDRLPDARERDRASAVLAEAFGYHHPEFAWQRATGIADENLRVQALYSAFEGLVEKNPALARETLGKAGLSPHESSSLSSLLP